MSIIAIYFQLNVFSIEALQYITTDQIFNVLRRYPMGIRIKFAYYIKDWQKSKYINNSSESPILCTISSSSLPAPVPSVPLEQQFSLDEVLTKTTQGTLITNYYKCHNSLNESHRNLLVNVIIANLLEKNRSMSVVLANNIADTIVGTFTTEIKVIYTTTFVPH